MPYINPAGSRFPMQGGTLAQLAVQPQRRMGTDPRTGRPIDPAMLDRQAAYAASQAPTSPTPAAIGGQTASPGFPGATIPGGMTFQDYNAQQQAAQPQPGPMAMQDRNTWLQNTPGYQFRFDEGQRAIERSAAARGTALTGGTLKELARFGSGLASQEFGNEADRLARLTQLGQAGAQQLGNYGTGYSATNAGLAEVGANNQIGLGNAMAGGTLAGVNASNAAGSQVAKNLGMIDWGALFGRKPQPASGPVMYGGPTDVTATA